MTTRWTVRVGGEFLPADSRRLSLPPDQRRLVEQAIQRLRANDPDVEALAQATEMEIGAGNSLPGTPSDLMLIGTVRALEKKVAALAAAQAVNGKEKSPEPAADDGEEQDELEVYIPAPADKKPAEKKTERLTSYPRDYLSPINSADAIMQLSVAAANIRDARGITFGQAMIAACEADPDLYLASCDQRMRS